MKRKQLTLTVGITTCYGDISIIDTVKSIRASEGVDDFRFIIVADRVPISPEIKRELKKYNVELIENRTEGSQIKKQKQILILSKSDLIVFTQDDVLLDPKALITVINNFTANPDLTMISILNKPIKATNFFENIINVGTEIASKTAKYWNNGDNYLSVIGRFMAFRTRLVKSNFRMIQSVATSDAYYYFENKRVGGIYKYLPEVYVNFKNPQNMKEHLRKSSRFQYSQKEMSYYFGDLKKEYIIPKAATLKALSEQIIQEPIKTLLYFVVYLYTRILKMKSTAVLNPIWEVDVSTKKLKTKL